MLQCSWYTEKQAYIYAAQTLKGAAEMVLETGEQPGVLKTQFVHPVEQR